MEQSWQYRSEIHEIPRIRKDLEMLATEWNIPPSKKRQILVIVEELFSNIVRFAYEDAQEHTIELRMKKDESTLHIEIIDDGIAFNPLDHSKDPLNDPSLASSGGMGLTLVQTFANKMSYQRRGDKNCLFIEKNL
jgi:anti-sigma regulatory factor (Ser/Thr protein kinase)